MKIFYKTFYPRTTKIKRNPAEHLRYIIKEGKHEKKCALSAAIDNDL